MNLNQHISPLKNRLTIFKVGLLFMLFNNFIASAQNVERTQDLNFGNFVNYGQGGTLTVTPAGIRSYTGEIISKSNPTPAIFKIYVDAGKTLEITYNRSVTLHGSNGGNVSLLLSDSSGSGSIFTGPSPTIVKLGGTLTTLAPWATPVGVYSGSFQVTFTVHN